MKINTIVIIFINILNRYHVFNTHVIHFFFFLRFNIQFIEITQLFNFLFDMFIIIIFHFILLSSTFNS